MKNSQLAVGYKDSMSFVVAGDMIGVFKQSRDGERKVCPPLFSFFDLRLIDDCSLTLLRI